MYPQCSSLFFLRSRMKNDWSRYGGGGAVGGVMVFNMAGWQDGGIETIHIMGPEVYDVYDVYDITHILMGFHGIPMR